MAKYVVLQIFRQILLNYDRKRLFEVVQGQITVRVFPSSQQIFLASVPPGKLKERCRRERIGYLESRVGRVRDVLKV